MNRRQFATSVAALPIGFAGLAHAAPDAGGDGDKVPLDKAELEKAFAETMSNAVLVGYFTTAGREKTEGLVEESYHLGKVARLDGEDQWSFEYRYGETGLSIALPPLEVKWAGDTPVITLTDFAIPGVGTFTARVLVYRGEYCGTWSAGDHGGQLFGRVQKRAAE